MPPNPEHSVDRAIDLSTIDDDDVCITGIAGMFPDSNNVLELQAALFDKRDLVSDNGRRWAMEHPELPKRAGTLPGVGKFDSAFFGVHRRQVHTMDPLGKLLLERAYEALFDAGINPKTLRGGNSAMLTCLNFSDMESICVFMSDDRSGSVLTGNNRGIQANRMAYWLGCQGPSYNIDSGTSGSLTAVHDACAIIKSGVSDLAIVGAANLVLHPFNSLEQMRLGVLSHDGSCRPFDQKASGVTRAEGVVVLVLQRVRNAKRVYARVVHSKLSSGGFVDEGVFPSILAQKRLLGDFYSEIGLDPSQVEYIEATGLATIIGDAVECQAIDEIMCKKRQRPLKIGCIKSNIGQTDSVAGLASIVKICIAYQTGRLPPNINYDSPNENIKGIVEGRIEVVTETTPWNRGLAAVSGLGFGGANAHVLLQCYDKKKENTGRMKDEVPRLVCVSGRLESAVNRIFDDLENNPIDDEMIGLLHDIHSNGIRGHVFRGYTILSRRYDPDGDNKNAVRDCQNFSGVTRPIWFVFSGMGSQWPASAKDLMRLPTFAASIEKCHDVLAPYGVNLKKILTDPDPTIFDNILNSFVAITSFQVALTDVLKQIGIVPDNIIGHSLGEAACSYADGCFTLEQTVLAAYYRGLVSIETSVIKGTMAAIGLGYTQIKDRCPPDVVVACHNGPESCTISGPEKSVKKFVEDLTKQDIFARTVKTNNIAYHSKYIKDFGHPINTYLKKVIPHPKKRSHKWLPTSLLQPDWDTKGEYISADYHTQNLLNPVFFEETSRHIPPNAITIELAPHGLLRAVLNRSLDKNCTNIALTDRLATDGLKHFLSSIGRLFEIGIDSQIGNLYPTIEYPVSNGTRMLSHLVEWDHSTEEKSFSFDEFAGVNQNSAYHKVQFSIDDESMEFIKGHIVDGDVIYPSSGYLILVWKSFCLYYEKSFLETPVLFENVRFFKIIHVNKHCTELKINIQIGSGEFEVSANKNIIVTGIIKFPEDLTKEFRSLRESDTGDNEWILSSEDVYKELKSKGYDYSGVFRGIQWSNLRATRGNVKWYDNWVALLENIMQFRLIGFEVGSLRIPLRIRRILIDTNRHNEALDNEMLLNMTYHKEIDALRCGGVEIRSFVTKQATRKSSHNMPYLERHGFFPNTNEDALAIHDIIHIDIQLALENLNISSLKCIEFVDSNRSPLMSVVNDVLLNDAHNIQYDLSVVSTMEVDLNSKIAIKANVEHDDHTIVIGSSLLQDRNNLERALSVLIEGGMVISRENINYTPEDFGGGKFNLVSDMKTVDEKVVMLQKVILNKKITYINVDNGTDEYNFVEEIKSAIGSIMNNEKIILVAQRHRTNGVLGLVRSLSKEIGKNRVGCIFILDSRAPPFDPELPFYKNQLNKGFAINVFAKGTWGTYKSLQWREVNNYIAKHAYCDIERIGDLSSLCWVEGPIDPKVDDNAVEVYYSSLNYRDILVASGCLSKEDITKTRVDNGSILGVEYAGRRRDGTRVMGLAKNKSIANVVQEVEDFTFAIPDNWSLEDAATIPMAYSVALYGLCHLAMLKSDESILVHSGMGAVGQACINYCLHIRCEIFVTVDSPENREALKHMFPQIPDDHIGSSSDTSFEDMIMFQTKGCGVDVVWNSLPNANLEASLRCMGIRGKCIELGMYDILNDTPIGMKALFKETSIYSLAPFVISEDTDIPNIFDKDIQKVVGKLLLEGIENGYVKPLSRTVFNVESVEGAFKFLASSGSAGKVLVKIRQEESTLKISPKLLLLKAIPRFNGKPASSYVVVGGLGNFGLKLIDWLIFNGVKKVIINSKRGISNGYQAYKIGQWKSFGVKIFISTHDASTQTGCVGLLKEAIAVGPVSGIFNTANIARNGLFKNQCVTSFRESHSSKALITQRLHLESSRTCHELEHFVVFSSTASIRGSIGQTNYAMANAAMERVCEERKSAGFPVHVIAVDTFVESETIVSCCLESLHRVLNEKDDVIFVAREKPRESNSTSLLATIARILGVDAKNSRNVRLKTFGMNFIMASAIKQCLARSLGMHLSVEEICEITFEGIETMINDLPKTSSINTDDEDHTGITAILKSIVKEDQSRYHTNMLTYISKGLDYNIGTEVFYTDPTLFIFPGIDGSADDFRTLCSRLRCRATVMQLGYDRANETIKETAVRCAGWIRRKTYQSGKFFLLGYSYGALVAIETAKLLESEGHTGKVFLVEGSPAYTRTLLRRTFEGDAECAILERAYELAMEGQDCSERLTSELARRSSWRDRVDAFAHLVHESPCHSLPHLLTFVDAVRARITNAMVYDGDGDGVKLRSNVVLWRIGSKASDLDDAYGLGQIADKSVEVHILDGSHSSILQNSECSNIINKFMPENPVTL